MVGRPIFEAGKFLEIFIFEHFVNPVNSILECDKFSFVFNDTFLEYVTFVEGGSEKDSVVTSELQVPYYIRFTGHVVAGKVLERVGFCNFCWHTTL